MALARLCQVTPREATLLLSAPRVQPVELDAAAAEAAAAALRAEGLVVELLDAPPSSSRCAAHPSLTTQGPCGECRQLACLLCLPVCPACAAKRARAQRRQQLRVLFLLAVLGGVALWGGLRQRAIARRHAWLRPLRVAVVLVSPEPVAGDVRAAWTGGLVTLEDWFAEEAARLHFHLERPVVLELAPAAVEADVPEQPEPTGEFVRDAADAVEFRAKLEALAKRGGATDDADVHIIVALKPPERGPHRVEGVAEAEGTIGLVEGTAGDTSIGLELIALGHEVLHLVGARDGYDANGHAQVPRGLVDPELGYPQDYAEVMVGEVPLAPGEGRVPKSLDEVRIGDVTAEEIGWLR